MQSIAEIWKDIQVQVSHKGIELVKRFECFISKAYLCPSGYKTIGFGHRTDEMTTITEPEAENLLKKDLKKIEDNLNYCLEHDNINLNQNQFDACISFIFNLGFSAFIFSTLYEKLKQGDYAGASAEFPKWVYITKTDKLTGERFKVKLKGLEQRRKAEQELFNL